jgi:hypothetical protein
MEHSNKTDIDVSQAMQTLKPSHLVYLRGYRERTSTGHLSAEELIAAWQKRQLSKGVLYSELCEHVPAWTDLAAAEIDHPTPFSFIEYSIIQPQYAAHGIPDISSALGKQFDVVDGLLASIFGF